MKKITLLIVLVLAAFITQAQVVQLSGPRVGGTVVTPGSSTDYIQNQNFPGDDGWGESTTPAFISQYGWQLETRFADGDEMVGLVEWVFLVGGMERGLFLPSVSSLFGMRSSSGFEAAFGPNLSLTGVGMVMAVGLTIKTANLNIPVNLSFVPGKNRTYEENFWDPIEGQEFKIETDYYTGSRISITLGFNLVQ
jgi:hypothetical protein